MPGLQLAVCKGHVVTLYFVHVFAHVASYSLLLG